MALRSYWIWVVVAILAASCKSSEPESRDCAPGRRGCPCGAEQGCKKHLTCLDGFCVPADCERGAEDCACGADGACAASDEGGEPLACASNLCVAASTPIVGALGGACDVAASGEPACPGGDALVCVEGVCELLGCPSSSVGCPCGSLGRCESPDGRAARCHQGRCVVAGCSDGGWGCLCATAKDCASGASCVEGLCRAPVVALDVGEASVRACDVLLSGVAEAAVVRFGAAVTGEVARRGSKAGLSWRSLQDAAPGQAVVVIESPPATTAAVQLVAAACFDGTGALVAEPGLVLR